MNYLNLTKDETEAMKALEERINHLADNAEEIFTKVNEVAKTVKKIKKIRNNYKITEKVEDKDGKVIRLALKRK